MTQTISIATWNVNSIRSRLTHLLEWLDADNAPDILCLQELKTVDEGVPVMEIEARGYNIATHGQKTYNGVAILSKFPMEDVIRGLPGNEEDDQARYIEAVISAHGEAVRVASVYVPNGQAVGSDKFAYKMRFFDFLRQRLQWWQEQNELQAMTGDYNVAPTPLDVYAPDKLEGTVCFHPDERAKLRTLEHLGFYDAYRCKHPQKQEFSWWDYRGAGWKQNHGLRIDHLLLSPQLQDRLSEAEILTDMRGAEKASDHAPVVAHVELGLGKTLFAA